MSPSSTKAPVQLDFLWKLATEASLSSPMHHFLLFANDEVYLPAQCLKFNNLVPKLTGFFWASANPNDAANWSLKSAGFLNKLNGCHILTGVPNQVRLRYVWL